MEDNDPFLLGFITFEINNKMMRTLFFTLFILESFLGYNQTKNTLLIADVKTSQVYKLLTLKANIKRVQIIPYHDDYAIAEDFYGKKFIIDKNFTQVSLSYTDIEPPTASIYLKGHIASPNNHFLVFEEVIGGKEKRGLLELTGDVSSPVKIKIPAKYDFLHWSESDFLNGVIYDETGKTIDKIIQSNGNEIDIEQDYLENNILYKAFSEIMKSHTKFAQKDIDTRMPSLCSLGNGYVAINIVNGYGETATNATHYLYNSDLQKVLNSKYTIELYSKSKKAILNVKGSIVNLKGEAVGNIPEISTLVKNGYGIGVYRNYFEQIGIAWIKVQDKSFLINEDFKVILKDFTEVDVWRDGSVLYRDLNGIWNNLNTKTYVKTALPKNFWPQVIFKGDKPFYYLSYTEPSNSERYIIKPDNSVQSGDGYNKVFVLSENKGIMTLGDLFPYAQIGDDFRLIGQSDIFQDKIFLQVNDKYLSKDKKQFTWNSSVEENCDEARTQYLLTNQDVKKAGMDPWTHYQNYGKKEGRVWPSCASSIAKKEVPSMKNDAASAAVAINLLKFLFYSSDNSSSENQNSQEKTKYETSPSENQSENFVFICNDCGKMKTHYSTPFDDTACPETRWGGRGSCSECIGDDGKHEYTQIGRYGKNGYVCNGCHIAIMVSSEGIQNNGACGGSGHNWSHNWIKEE